MPAVFAAPAKLNLFLHITSRRADGYHNLQTLFQLIDFCDQLSFSDYETEGEIRLHTDIPTLNNPDNLILRAAEALRETTGCKLGAQIKLSKTIPMGAGLGGGSSNAATTLVALNQLWQTGLSNAQLCRIGASLGADVPLFVAGHNAFAEGIGEQLTPVKLPQSWFLLYMPNCHVNTATLFKHPELARNTASISLQQALGKNTGHNDFEPLARKLFPAIEAGFKLLQGHSPRLTGTGATIFCPFASQAEAVAAQERASAAAASGHYQVCAGLEQSPLLSG